MKPLELRCAECGALLGYFVPELLDRMMRAAVRAILGDAFPSEDAQADGAPPKLPFLCVTCEGKTHG